jgi:hypothetical protein
MGIKKIRNFTLISKWGFLSVYQAPTKSQNQKTRIFRDFFYKQYFGSNFSQ